MADNDWTIRDILNEIEKRTDRRFEGSDNFHQAQFEAHRREHHTEDREVDRRFTEVTTSTAKALEALAVGSARSRQGLATALSVLAILSSIGAVIAVFVVHH